MDLCADMRIGGNSNVNGVETFLSVKKRPI